MFVACSGPIQDNATPQDGANPVAQDETAVPVRIVNADGASLPGMIPVAYDGPSMLAELVAQGDPANTQGESQLNYPTDKWVYLRAVDPNGAMMAAGHVELKPGHPIDPDEPLQLNMAAAASVTAEVHRADGAPVASAPVALVLVHPAHGQWWRAEAQSDATGHVTFSGLPAGVYALKVEMGEAGEASIREAVLVGGEEKDVGVIAPHAGE